MTNNSSVTAIITSVYLFIYRGFGNLSYDHIIFYHYSDVIMSAMVYKITGVSIVCSTVCSGTDHKDQSSASLAFVRGIHGDRWIPLKKGQ